MTSPGRDECLQAGARVLAEGYAAQALMTPREQAEAAWEPTCGMTVDELEARIRTERGIEEHARSA